jgi:ABC-type amino acid transport substrate-binding protein
MKILKLIVTACLALGLTTSAVANDLAKIREKGFMEIAVYEAFPPFSYKSEKGESIGIDIDLGRAIAKALGVQVGFRLFPADESMEDDLRNVVWKGHYLGGGVADLMLHVPYDPNFAKTIEQVTFFSPYYREQIAFAVNPGRIGSAKTLEVFKTEKVGVTVDSLADMYLLAAFGGNIAENVVHFLDVQKATTALLNGELTAVMANRAELEHSLEVSSDRKNIIVTQIPTPGLTIDGWDVGAAVKAGNDELSTSIIEIIETFKTDGTLEKIYADHGVTYTAPDTK